MTADLDYVRIDRLLAHDGGGLHHRYQWRVAA